MWRQRDMTGLMKAWRQATITAEKRMEKAKVRKEKGDRARIGMAVKLIRRGAISRAGKALESRGLGDLQDGSIWEQIEAKHPERKRQIPDRAWAFVPEEELKVKVDKILPKLDVYAAPDQEDYGTHTCECGHEYLHRRQRTKKWSIWKLY